MQFLLVAVRFSPITALLPLLLLALGTGLGTWGVHHSAEGWRTLRRTLAGDAAETAALAIEKHMRSALLPVKVQQGMHG